jgi:hypothetical protein
MRSEKQSGGLIGKMNGKDGKKKRKYIIGWIFWVLTFDLMLHCFSSILQCGRDRPLILIPDTPTQQSTNKKKNNLLSMTCNLLAEATMSFLKSLSCKYPFLKWKNLESLGVAKVQCSL